MAVAASNASTSSAFAGTTSTSNSAYGQLVSTYDTFLKMLTTQLKVQNPLDPMDAEKFTEQLVQYSSVEQQIQTNQNLEDMLATMVSSATLSLVNYIGKKIEAISDVTQLKGGKAVWSLDSAAAAKDATITVRNSAGAVVYEGKMDLEKGENEFEWDGKLANGQEAPEGEYQISVTAADEDGNAVAVTTRVTGIVTGVDTSGAIPYLKIGNTSVPLGALRKILG
jgi:flagellar basal-body rod modification protein FlgD